MKTAAGTLAGLIVLSGVGQISGNVKGAEKPEEAEVLFKGDWPEPVEREKEDGGTNGEVTWAVYTNYYAPEEHLLPTVELEATVNGDLSYVPSEYTPWPWCIAWANSINIATVSGNGLTDANSMFYNCASLVDLDISGLDTNNVTDMGSMFYGCKELKSLDLSNFYTDEVENMSYMFADSSSLEELVISGFNTEKVTNMNNMFSDCTGLKKLDLSSFDTKHVEGMECMFDGCNSLETLNTSSFETDSLKNMNYMFRDCEALKKIDLSGFNTSKVEELISVFENCESLTKLDLSSFDTANVKILQEMCVGCSSLESLDLSSFDLTSLKEWYSVSGVLSGCYNLKVVKTPKVLSENYKIDLPLDEEETQYMNTSGKLRNQIVDASDVYTKYEYPVKSVKFDKTKLNMTVGESAKLKILFNPENASIKTVTWKSNNSNVATVDGKGNIKAVGVGGAEITVTTLDGSKTAICTVTVKEKKPDPKPEVTIDMFRMYNPNSGEHFYTASAVEKDTLIKAGWNYEGLAWKAPEKSGAPVYRLYNPNAGDHHYTMSVEEKETLEKAGWNYEGIGWYSDEKKAVPLLRLYNPNAISGSHHYTVSEAEKDTLVKAGWKDEGVAWYGK